MTSADGTERFLRELRELRDGAGLGHAELAARAHYPYDTIKAAEVGPALPDLPVLSAFVKGCGGTTEEWEERWRSLTRSPSLPLSEARSAGDSAAAAAGARIGSASPVEGNPDPSIIMAALNRVAEGMASGNDGAPSPADDASSWPDFPPAAAAGHPADVPPSFEPDVAAVPAPDVTASFEPDAPVPSFPAPGLPSEPAAGGLPPGWDPIRVSTAWPAIPDSLLDATLSSKVGAEAPPWESAPWAQDLPAPTPGARGAVPGGWGQRPRTAPATPARSTRRAAPRAGAAGASRAWMVAVAVVLLCVLVVVLAIFA